MNYQDMKDFLSKMSDKTLMFILLGMLDNAIDVIDDNDGKNSLEVYFTLVFTILREVIEERPL